MQEPGFAEATLCTGEKGALEVSASMVRMNRTLTLSLSSLPSCTPLPCQLTLAFAFCVLQQKWYQRTAAPRPLHSSVDIF